MKKAAFPLLCLVFVITCAVLVYHERNAVPAYVEVISIREVPEEVEVPENAVLVNINTANLDELTTLKGIGPAIGQRIIDYREHSGLFMSKEELMEVSGIGEKVFEGIKDMITF